MQRTLACACLRFGSACAILQSDHVCVLVCVHVWLGCLAVSPHTLRSHSVCVWAVSGSYRVCVHVESSAVTLSMPMFESLKGTRVSVFRNSYVCVCVCVCACVLVCVCVCVCLSLSTRVLHHILGHTNDYKVH